MSEMLEVHPDGYVYPVEAWMPLRTYVNPVEAWIPLKVESRLVGTLFNVSRRVFVRGDLTGVTWSADRLALTHCTGLAHVQGASIGSLLHPFIPLRFRRSAVWACPGYTDLTFFQLVTADPTMSMSVLMSELIRSLPV